MTGKPWTPREDAVIRLYAGKLRDQAIAALLGRTAMAVKFRRHQITDVAPLAPLWSEAEMAILRDRYATTARAELQALLPSRPWTAIMTKAQSLGLAQRSRRTPLAWTEADRAKLRELYPSTSITAMLPHFPGRTALSIAQEAGRLGVQHTTDFWRNSAARNHPRQYPPELRALIQLNHKLKKAINAREQPQHR